MVRCCTRILTCRTWGLFRFGLFFINCKNEAKEMMLSLCHRYAHFRQKYPFNCVSFKTARGKKKGLWTLHFFLSYFNFRFFLRTWLGWMSCMATLVMSRLLDKWGQTASSRHPWLSTLLGCLFISWISFWASRSQLIPRQARKAVSMQQCKAQA